MIAAPTIRQVGSRDYANSRIRLANGEEKTPAEFIGPLRYKCSWYQHEYAMIIRVIDNVLPDKNASLDRFAEPNLVRKEVSLDWVLKYAPDDFDLVGFKLYPRREQSGHAERSPALVH